MPAQYTRADAMREWLTGALTDGGPQANPDLSLGGYRSSTEGLSLGITIATPIPNVTVLYAGGANPTGPGILTAVDANHLTWQPNGATSPGSPTSFSGVSDIEIVEADNLPGQYLRISGSPPFPLGLSTISLAYLVDNVFGLSDITIAQALTGVNQYRATMVRNEGSGPITAFQRWIASLGTQQVSNGSFLSGAGGPGTLTTTGSFSDWPANGWCQVQDSSGSLKEVVYYSSRTNTTLTVPGAGRGLLGTAFAAGTSTDIIIPVPGVAIGVDPTGVQAFGNAIQQIPNQFSAPAGVAWNLGVTMATGLQIGSLPVSTEVGVWIWRQIPAGAKSNPLALTKFLDSFNAF